MAANNVIGQVLGGEKKVLDGMEDVSDVRDELGLSSDYSATVNGQPADDETPLRDNDFVSFTRKVKGGK